jgi:hypothetical protein
VKYFLSGNTFHEILCITDDGSVREIGLHILIICWSVQTGMFTSPIHPLGIDGLSLFWMKSVQKDQLKPSSFHDRHAGDPLGVQRPWWNETREKRLMTTSISHIQRETQCSLASNPYGRRHQFCAYRVSETDIHPILKYRHVLIIITMFMEQTIWNVLNKLYAMLDMMVQSQRRNMSSPRGETFKTEGKCMALCVQTSHLMGCKRRGCKDPCISNLRNRLK